MTEHGVSWYEAETMLRDKHRDFEAAAEGLLLVVGEKPQWTRFPPRRRLRFLRTVGAGTLGMVDLFKRRGETMYEAAYKSQGGKKREVLVKADGTETKE